MSRRLLLLAGLCLTSLAAAQQGPEEPAQQGTEGEDPQQPASSPEAAFLQRYCVRCHRRPEPEGLVLLEGQDPARPSAQPRLWLRVLRQLREGAMPPEGKQPRPSPEEASAFVARVESTLAAQGAVDPGRVTLRRLNRDEYDNAVRDLFGVHTRPARRFPDDGVAYGFDTVGDALTVPPLLLERALEAAEEVAREAVQVYRPLARRFEAEALPKTARGGNRDGWAVFSTNGEVAVLVNVPHEGEYALRARAYGMQAGPDPCRLALRVDGREAGQVDVRALQAAPEEYAATVRLEAGSHTLAAAFVNDYYRPEDPDPANRDRNLAVDWIELVGPAAPPALPEFHRRYVADSAEVPALAVTLLVRRVLRRDDADPAPFLALYRRLRETGDTHEQAFQGVVVALLVHPRFLFRVEQDPAPGATARLLDEWELATRLAAFLWSSTPDDDLLARARAGELRAQLAAQVDRLLDDPRAEALVQRFAGQWLELRRLEEASPDPQAFPEFDEGLRASMLEETERFVTALLREDRSLLDLLRARFTFVDERLARHYGIPGVTGPRFRRVTLPPERAGILTHASVLTITSHPTRTSPVRRGKWVLEALLDAPPPDPPPGVASLTPAEEARPESLRAQLERHRAQPECASCHDRLDPLGFGLERFDAIGRRRDLEAGTAIDASGVLPDGARFDDAAGLRDYLLERRGEEVALAVARKLFVFALGRAPREADEPALRALVRGLAPDYRLKALVQGLVRLDAFQQRGRSE